MSNSKIGFLPSVSIVIANMVGVGVFTSLGFQLIDITDYRAILMIWVVGGALALLGSLCYAELSASFPKSGGEYHFLRLSFGEYTGFLSGWTSAIVGFAAPIAAAAHAFSKYFSNVVDAGIHPLLPAAAIIVLITLIHVQSMKMGARFQVYFTVGKVITMVLFIVAGLLMSKQSTPISNAQGSPLTGDMWGDILGASFWVNLIFVSYAYSGWNATSYMIDDIKDPVRNVPRSILAGTLAVMALYVLINYVFLLSGPADQLKGKEDVANAAANFLFGSQGALLISCLISFFLISTISSMIIVGPRVIKRISQDYPSFNFFAASSGDNIPVRSLILQSGIALLILFTSSFEFIVTSMGFILTIFTTLTAASVIVMRIKDPSLHRPLKTPLYPLIPLLYCGFNLWILYHTIINKPIHVMTGLCFLAIGTLFYVVIKKKSSAVAALVLLLFVGVSSCNNPSEKQPTLPPPVTAKPQEAKIDSLLTHRSELLAGKKNNELSVINAQYAERINTNWQQSEEKLFNPIRNFCTQEGLTKNVEGGYGVFYPFSGPDVAFAQTFYPDAKIYILAGLEKAGDTSSIVFSKQPNYESFFKNAETYFYFSGRIGFFRTLDMEKHFADKGVADIIAFYLQKRNCNIISMELMKWDTLQGAPIPATGNNQDICYVKFAKPNKEVADLYYFSRDLSTPALQKDSLWLKWVEHQFNGLKMASLTKSASYLMHYDKFSEVRNFLLTKSLLHIQDDSGIGFQYILDSKRPYQIYGKYSRTIPVFNYVDDRAIKNAYQNGNPKPMPFNIGYNVAHGEPNLQVIN